MLMIRGSRVRIPLSLKNLANNRLESSRNWNVLSNDVTHFEILRIFKKLHDVLVQNWQ